jgi:hypothetical protein
MARLFIFAIGGTGSRVLKSLSMLLASGVNTHNDYEIVPIIIDPHKSNEDLKRTERILLNYQAITNSVGTENGFFGTKITTLNNLEKTEHVNTSKTSPSFTFDLQKVGGKKFKEYIDFNLLNESNKALADILFSGKSINKRNDEVNLLDVEMDIGFVGNPNIGSVVLNQFKDSQEFKDFANKFDSRDRVFIISSIFGGTGAAGFPIILKTIRDALNIENLQSKGLLQDAMIGAITVLPYFNLETETVEGNKSPIQRSQFIAKTKAALSYYDGNLNQSINTLYYIADVDKGKSYKNDPGDNGQKNDAHFIELVSALAIIDFLEIDDSNLQCSNGDAINPIYKEFAMRNESDSIKFSDFDDYTESKIAKRLSQLTLFHKYIKEHINTSIEKEVWSTDKPEIDKKFMANTFYRTNLLEFLDSFQDWLEEMAKNKRGFAPFDLQNTLENFIKDKVVDTGFFKKKLDYNYFNTSLAKKCRNINYITSNQKFIKLFYDTTEDILKEKFGF